MNHSKLLTRNLVTPRSKINHVGAGISEWTCCSICVFIIQCFVCVCVCAFALIGHNEVTKL